MMTMKTTVEHFNLTIDQLLETDQHGYTKEENLLFNEGLSCTFFDNEQEMYDESDDFRIWLEKQGYEIAAMLQTVNERIAVILQ